MLAAGTPAPAADTIEELLREDEASSQNDALRVDLNALTEAEWEYYFQVGLKKVDTQLDGKLVEHESDLGVIYVWIAALAAGFGIAIGAIKAWPSMRRVMRILLVPVMRITKRVGGFDAGSSQGVNATMTTTLLSR
jgi:hypothetical protein